MQTNNYIRMVVMCIFFFRISVVCVLPGCTSCQAFPGRPIQTEVSISSHFYWSLSLPIGSLKTLCLFQLLVSSCGWQPHASVQVLLPGSFVKGVREKPHRLYHWLMLHTLCRLPDHTLLELIIHTPLWDSCEIFWFRKHFGEHICFRDWFGVLFQGSRWFFMI